MICSLLTAFSPRITVRLISALLSLLICFGVYRITSALSVTASPPQASGEGADIEASATDANEKSDSGADNENSDSTPMFGELTAEDIGGAISASSAITCNITKDTVISRKNVKAPLPAEAAVTLVTALTVMRAVSEGSTSPAERAVCPASAAKLPSYRATSHILSVGQSLTVSELVRCMLCAEPQVFAYTLAIHICGSEADFIGKMNVILSELGAKDTAFTSLSDLSLQTTTVYDCAVILRNFLKNTELAAMLASGEALVIASGGSAWNTVTLCNRFYSECCTSSQAHADGITAGYFFTVGSAQYVYTVFESGSESYITLVADAATGYADALVLRSRV